MSQTSVAVREHELLTTAQAARRAGVTTPAIRRAIAMGRLDAQRGKGGVWRISPPALRAWMGVRSGAAPVPRPIPDAAPDDILLVKDERPFVLHMGFDGWRDIEDRPSAQLSPGLHAVRLRRTEISQRRQLNFTRFYPEEGRWEGHDHVVALGG
ncbi:MAG: glucoamylase [Miltoncostaeaceae bacterium]|jgi:excisionase family DNA binding protein|nr:glucoamylase [Miltoncostaeaceae bacterium]